MVNLNRSSHSLSMNYIKSTNFNKNSAVKRTKSSPETTSITIKTKTVNEFSPVEEDNENSYSRKEPFTNIGDTQNVVKRFVRGAKRVTGKCIGRPTERQDSRVKIVAGGSRSLKKKPNEYLKGYKTNENSITNEAKSFETGNWKSSTSRSSIGTERRRKNNKEKHSKKVKSVSSAEKIFNKIKKIAFLCDNKKAKKKKKKKTDEKYADNKENLKSTSKKTKKRNDGKKRHENSDHERKDKKITGLKIPKYSKQYFNFFKENFPFFSPYTKKTDKFDKRKTGNEKKKNSSQTVSHTSLNDDGTGF